MSDGQAYMGLESLKDAESEDGGIYSRWMAELIASDKELTKFRTKGRKVVKAYRAEVSETGQIDSSVERAYNLFPANVNILATALMNQTPKPDVYRAFGDFNDDVARVACQIMERAVSSHNDRNFHTSSLLRQVVQDMLVPGMGISWHTYHAEIEHRSETLDAETSTSSGSLVVNEVDQQTLVETGHEEHEKQPPTNQKAELLEWDEIVSETILDEYVYWEDLCWSPARCYDEVRWIGRKTYLTRDQLVKRFGKKMGDAIPLDSNPKKVDHNVATKNHAFQQACIYEIWDKPSHKVYWLSKAYPEILDEKDDYLELDDFFPCPVPMVSTISNGQYIPIPDYHFAKDQYRELNEINTRISLLVRACRLAGVYDKSAQQLPALINNAAENTLVPVDQWAAFAERGGIKGAIEWLPLDQIVITIEQLTKNREDVKNQIYEITGMSDIIRGQSKASETLGAQKIKTQYASMRIQERQKNVVQYTSAVFDIQVQLMRKHMDIQEIVKLSQAMFLQEDPQIVQQALQLIKEPDFVLRCRVESDSLSDIDFQAEKQDRMEYMMTITNYLKEVLPTMQNDPVMGPFLMHMLQFSLAGFKVGKKFEGEMDRTFRALEQKLANPPPPQPSPEQMKMQMEQEKAKLDAQGKQQDQQMRQQEGQQKLAMQAREGQQKLQLASQEGKMKMQVLTQENQMKLETAGIQDQIERQKMWRQQQQSAIDFEQNARDQFAEGGRKRGKA